VTGNDTSAPGSVAIKYFFSFHDHSVHLPSLAEGVSLCRTEEVEKHDGWREGVWVVRSNGLFKRSCLLVRVGCLRHRLGAGSQSGK
jgi:hypothetical protein